MVLHERAVYERFWRLITAVYRAPEIGYNKISVTQDLMATDRQGGELAPLEDFAQRARGFMEAAKAENTRRAYRSDWRHFESWCQSHGLAFLPAAPETVALYLAALAADHKPASLQRKLTSITKAHNATAKARKIS